VLGTYFGEIEKHSFVPSYWGIILIPKGFKGSGSTAVGRFTIPKFGSGGVKKRQSDYRVVFDTRLMQGRLMNFVQLYYRIPLGERFRRTNF